jgi:tetratricopeptide (TPR) repeat protein
MSTEQPTTADISTTEEEIEQICSSFKSVVATTSLSSIQTDTKPHTPSHIRIVQNFILIWLDTNLDEESDNNCRNTVAQLRNIVNTVKRFIDADECIDFLTDTQDEKIFLVLCASLAQRAVPLIHEIAQLDSIYILSKNKLEDNCWTPQSTKVRGVFTEITLICDKLKQATQQLDQNTISISFMPTSAATINPKLNKLHQSFMYTQMFKEILLTIDFDRTHIKNFADYWREQCPNNDRQLDLIDKFEDQYHHYTPIWWYSCECFLYSMVNRALRTMETDIIVKMGFFLSDLHRQIEQLHGEQFCTDAPSPSFVVYRCQGLSKTDFHKMTETKGGLISFNNFLSTSQDQQVSTAFTGSSQSNPDLIDVLFVIIVDPSKTSTPFALVNEVSFYKTENEVLFSMHAIFRIGEIERLTDHTDLWKIEITLTSENDQGLAALTENMHKWTEGWGRWNKLVLLFINLGQHDKAQNLLEMLPDETTCDEQNPLRLQLVGMTTSAQGQSSKALSYFEKALGIQEETLSANHPDFGISYNNIGGVYFDMGEYSKALSYYEKALGIYKETLPANSPHLAYSYSNIGEVYSKMGVYSKALSYYEKALGIRQETLSANHPHLAHSYSNIGEVYSNMGEYSKALSYYEKALGMQEETLSANHHDLAKSYSNIGQGYSSMGEYFKALAYYEKALGMHQETLPENHPILASSYNNIGAVYFDMGEYSKALSYYEKALGMKQETLPANHPDLAISYNNIGLLYYNMGEYSKALSYYEKAFGME